jgi:uncharacterized FlaG/YvyC family protein
MDISSVGNLAADIGASAEPAPAQPLSGDQRSLIQAVRTVNAAEPFGSNNEVTFSVDRYTRSIVVRVVDRTTHEVVDQIPQEYLLRLAEEMSGRNDGTP